MSMSTEQALRAAIDQHPDDDTPRLELADWYESDPDAGAARGRTGAAPMTLSGRDLLFPDGTRITLPPGVDTHTQPEIPGLLVSGSTPDPKWGETGRLGGIVLEPGITPERARQKLAWLAKRLAPNPPPG
jgi:uncharacterized protein (TIGR02996 family)